uniref:TGFBR3/Endoglin-like N-terminal domain-containing protein n=1 Tax=Knipowitschia caucasica TaxID=637954 RepID=A0AAV2IUP2_KNICA
MGEGSGPSGRRPGRDEALLQELEEMSKNSSISFHGNKKNIFQEDVPSDDKKLLKWATQRFGGVTSFTTVKNLRDLHAAGVGTKAGFPDCVLGNEDSAEKHFLTIGRVTASFKSCFPTTRNDNDELHIVNVPERSTVRNVLLHMDLEKSSIFLRGPQGTNWTVLNLQNTKLSSNNEILIRHHSLVHRLPPAFPLDSDEPEVVQRKALDYFRTSSFTSYTEITTDGSALVLRLPKKAVNIVSETAVPVTTSAPQRMPLTMLLYNSRDFSSPLDPNAKVQSNRRIYAEISGRALGDITLTIKVTQCFLRSKGSCPVVKELPFLPESCHSTSCSNTTRLSFSLDQLQELTSTTWDLECSVKICYSEKCGDGERVKRSLEVTQPCLQPQNQILFSSDSVLVPARWRLRRARSETLLAVSVLQTRTGAWSAAKRQRSCGEGRTQTAGTPK